ncbi:MFS transporter, FHS family, L-fucose permease [Chishuiella changwenlii]|uniref:Glucose transporter n=1 Tax=Chishuiella changwenlii TaxID=1434701 RepID=A0A1M6VWH3_9FLAO|nr:MFS transporter [Chishuiella changwenlii]GGE89788.1 glucose transporter [Chishuiella changwenlii]SHK85728.1 MFS transporter, FHS family, L-fucose permease [Chishuiella changwenlii]
MKTNKHYIWPFAIVTFIYFIVGFLTTVNEQLQAPLKVTFLSEAGNYKNTLTTSITFFFFLGYLLNSTLGSKWVNIYGYQKTIIRGLLFIIAGLSMYLTSTWVGYTFPDSALHFSSATIPYGFLFFIFGSFLMGTSAAIIQVVVNPYVASYNLKGTTSVQRLNITTGINSIGTTAAPFFVTLIMFSGTSIENVQIQQLLIPLAVLILIILIVTFLTSKLSIPDIANTRASEEEPLERSIWSFRHFVLGVLAIFFYVGTEVAIGANINLYAFELMQTGRTIKYFGHTDLIIGGKDLGIHAFLSTLYWGGFLVGRVISSFLKNVSARQQLITTSSLAAILVIIAMTTENIWFLVAIGLLHSSMWSCIYSLSINGLKQYTSKASGVFVSAVFGGAVFTLVQGGLADYMGSWRWTWILSVICELLILSYALFGSTQRKKDILP